MHCDTHIATATIIKTKPIAKCNYNLAHCLTKWLKTLATYIIIIIIKQEKYCIVLNYYCPAYCTIAAPMNKDSRNSNCQHLDIDTSEVT